MTKLKVVQGGGGHRVPPSPDLEWASEHLLDLLVETFRAVVRGDDYGDRVSRELTALVQHCAETKLQLRPLLQEVASAAKRAILEGPERSEPADEMAKIVLAALLVAAESIAADEYAKARRFQRLGELRAVIEQHIISTETRSREHGWSYLEHLTKELAKTPQARGPRGRKGRG